MLDFANAAFCLDILQAAAHNRGVCVRRIASRQGCEPCDVLDVLSDLTLAGVVECRMTDVPGFLSLALGPSALRAVYLFALNCDDSGQFPEPAFSRAGDDPASVSPFALPDRADDLPAGVRLPACGDCGRPRMLYRNCAHCAPAAGVTA